MRNGSKYCKQILTCICLAIPVAVGHAAETPANSVVRINVSMPGSKSVGSGFAWTDARYVVTALHVVAGPEQGKQIVVYSEGAQRRSKAKLVRAILEADLALLELDREIGLKPLEFAEADATTTNSALIWGFPHDVSEMTGHRVDLVAGTKHRPDLSSIFRSPAQFTRAVGAQGYPQLGAKILRVSKLQPGHSGAPLLDANGKVIGIGDGGLRDGLAGLNWAISAASYLPKLSKSTDLLPDKLSAQKKLFSTPADDSVWALDLGGGRTLRLVWSATVAEIASSIASEEVDAVVAEERRWALKDSGRDISTAIINVYEDSVSGTTFAVPAELPIEYDPERQLLTTRRKTGPKMLVQIQHYDSFEAARQRIAPFQSQFIDGLSAWEPNQEWPDVEEIDADDDYIYASKNRVFNTPDGDPDESEAEVYVDTQVSDGEFLGTVLLLPNMSEFTPLDYYHQALTDVCIEFAFFDYKSN